MKTKMGDRREFLGFIQVQFHGGPQAWRVHLETECVEYVGDISLTLRRTRHGNPISSFTITCFVEMLMPIRDLWGFGTEYTPQEDSEVSSARTPRRRTARISVRRPTNFGWLAPERPISEEDHEEDPEEDLEEDPSP